MQPPFWRCINVNIGIALGISFINRVKKLIAFDNFNRPDSSSLGVSPSGHLWGGVGGEIKNKSYMSFGGGVSYINVGKSDYVVSTDMNQIGSGNLGLAIRIKDGANFYTLRIYQQKLEIYKFTPSATLIGSYDGGWSGLVNVKVEAKGNTMKAYVNNVLVLTITDNDLLTFTQVGYRGGGESSFAKNLVVEDT
jgi:hypothetical protein